MATSRIFQLANYPAKNKATDATIRDKLIATMAIELHQKTVERGVATETRQ